MFKSAEIEMKRFSHDQKKILRQATALRDKTVKLKISELALLYRYNQTELGNILKRSVKFDEKTGYAVVLPDLSKIHPEKATEENLRLQEVHELFISKTEIQATIR